MARYDARKLRNGMKYEISNEYLKVKADTEGAILWSVTDKDGFEYIWQGDDRYWNEHGANLFPYIARLWEKSYIFQGKTYHMDIHGFAKDSVFSCEKAGENELVFAMEDTRETLEQYPFHFRFEIRYLLEKNTLKVFYSVKNKDEKTMYFGIGGHPGFNIPIQSDEVFEDYDIVFEEKEEQKCPTLDMESCLIDFEKTNFELDDTDTIPLQHSLFYRDALVFENLNSTCVSLKSRQSGRGVMMEFSGFPMLGIWSAANDGPYVALEPWTGCATAVQEDDVFEKKHGMRTLQPGEEAEYAYTVFEI